MKYKCKCGYEANKKSYIIEHIMILEPHKLYKSRLLPFVTDEKVNESNINYAKWQNKHGLII